MEKFLNTFSFMGAIVVILMGLTVVLTKSINYEVPNFIEPVILVTLFLGGISVMILVIRRSLGNKEN